MNLAAQVIELVHDAGFDLAGIAPCVPPPDADRFERWLDLGYHAGMAYLEQERQRIADPRRLLPTGSSILIVGLAHARGPTTLGDGARLARYAAGRDYHNVIGGKLVGLARALSRRGWIQRSRKVIDAGPMLERSHAARAGLGFPSKAANLLHPEFGPWFFLGELILDVELEPTATPASGSCGTCRACIDACPTEAIREPGVVDAGRCISYHTIENRGRVPTELRTAIGPWVFGCDVCSEVCPWGRRTADVGQRLGTHPVVESHGLVELIERQEPVGEWLRGSPMQRAKREGLARNAAIVLGNRPTERGRLALLQALTFDPSAIVREAAGWALAEGHRADHGTSAALEAAAARDENAAIAADLRGSRERCD